MMPAPDRLAKPGAWICIMICLGFAVITGHVWEDFFITFRSSLHLATGQGLVFQPGERVHSFTSPLGTLLPALFALGGGEGVEWRALWGLRLVSAAALAIALVFALRVFAAHGFTLAALAGVALWVLDPKIVDFSMNGMECGLLIFFVVQTWRALVGGARLWPLALGLAGLQWTRPDGFVFGSVLLLSWLVLAESPRPALSARLLALLRAGLLSIACYLPWLLWAWLYYGSPIPHTIQAKETHGVPTETLFHLLLYPFRLLTGQAALHDVFMPAYYYFGGWPGAVTWFARLLTLGGALAWLWPAIKSPARLASAAFFLGGLYVETIPRSPWYYPAWQVLACLAWAGVFSALWSCRPDGVWHRVVRTVALCLVALQATLLAAVAWQMRTQQTLIENRHRREIGRWLAENAATGDRVYLEPLGYIGYYSGLKMLDHPGLASPEVVAARASGHHTHAAIIEHLRPEWLVLRPDQVQSVQAVSPALLGVEYRLLGVFDTRAEIDAIAYLPGRGYLDFDAVFYVFGR
jgi:hypothetical protein